MMMIMMMMMMSDRKSQIYPLPSYFILTRSYRDKNISGFGRHVTISVGISIYPICHMS